MFGFSRILSMIRPRHHNGAGSMQLIDPSASLGDCIEPTVSLDCCAAPAVVPIPPRADALAMRAQEIDRLAAISPIPGAAVPDATPERWTIQADGSIKNKDGKFMADEAGELILVDQEDLKAFMQKAPSVPVAQAAAPVLPSVAPTAGIALQAAPAASPAAPLQPAFDEDRFKSLLSLEPEGAAIVRDPERYAKAKMAAEAATDRMAPTTPEPAPSTPATSEVKAWDEGRFKELLAMSPEGRASLADPVKYERDKASAIAVCRTREQDGLTGSASTSPAPTSRFEGVAKLPSQFDEPRFRHLLSLTSDGAVILRDRERYAKAKAVAENVARASA